MTDSTETEGKVQELERLQRTWCRVNTWELTKDQDEAMNLLHDIENAIRALGLDPERETSRGWWLYQLHSTEAAWLEWWGDGRRGINASSTFRLRENTSPLPRKPN